MRDWRSLSLCAFALRCTFFAVPFCVFLRCCFAWPFATYNTLHTSGRALSGAVSLCSSSSHCHSHTTPSRSLTLSARCCCAAYASFFQASPIPSAFLTIFITQSPLLSARCNNNNNNGVPLLLLLFLFLLLVSIAAFYAAK